MLNRLDALKRTLFLRDLPDEALLSLAEQGVDRTYDVGESLFAEREAVKGLFVVRVGTVRLARFDTMGRELTLGRAKPGDSVGEIALFDGGNYPHDAIADEDNTVVFTLPRGVFLAQMTQFPEIAIGGLRLLTIQNRRLLEMLKAQTLHTVRTRLATFLLAHAEGDYVLLPENNTTLGAHIGTVREVISRTLHGFEDSKVIRLDGRKVTLLDKNRLQEIAQELG
jgi:CRP/FNR family transcriptional regulator, dissimilatory nitrate respiration regulator